MSISRYNGDRAAIAGPAGGARAPGSRTLRAVTAAVCLAAAVVNLQPSTGVADTLVLKGGKRIPVTKIIYRRATKEFVAVTEQGQIVYSEDKVQQALVAKPGEYKLAQQRLEQKDFKGAIPLFEKVWKDYAKLEWDKAAKAQLAYAYFMAEDMDRGIRLAEEIFADPTAPTPPGLGRLYLNGLMKKKDYAKLENEFVKIIGTGSRETAAGAQLLRGDIFMDKKQYREALIKGYMRTAELYQDVKDVQPEALFKAAQCCRELGDTEQAAMFRKRLLDKFPDSEFAARARKESP